MRRRLLSLICLLAVAGTAGAQQAPQYYNPDWSPDGRTILFESTRDGKFAIYRIGADGSRLTRLTSGEANDEQPRWSRDGRRIVFISDRDGHLQLYTMRADGSDQRRLTNTTAVDYDPAFSPDASKVVFMTRPERTGANHTIALVNADGTGRVSLTDGSANDMSPMVSPDGRWIAFERGPRITKPYRELSEGERAALRNGREIYVVGTDGAAPRRVTHNDVFDAAPLWPGTSRRIYFISAGTEGEGVYSLPLAGGQPRLVAPIGLVMRPSLSRDGKRLAYAKNDGGRWGIYIYDIRSKKERLLIP